MLLVKSGIYRTVQTALDALSYMYFRIWLMSFVCLSYNYSYYTNNKVYKVITTMMCVLNISSGDLRIYS